MKAVGYVRGDDKEFEKDLNDLLKYRADLKFTKIFKDTGSGKHINDRKAYLKMIDSSWDIIITPSLVTLHSDPFALMPKNIL